MAIDTNLSHNWQAGTPTGSQAPLYGPYFEDEWNRLSANDADLQGQIDTINTDTGGLQTQIDDVVADVATLDGEAVKTTGAQSVAGVKTFTDTPVGTTFSRQAIFTSSGTWNVPVGVLLAYGKVIGGGGGGGGNNSGPVSHGGGGGGGGVAEGFFTPSALEAVTITIGSGGAGGSIDSDGTAGTTTSIGAYLVANGGSAGGGGHVIGDGGLSGIGTTGDILSGLGDGSTGHAVSGGTGGAGGGPGGRGVRGGEGGDAPGYGGGGGGGSAGGTGAGGAGKDGLVIIWY
jgi:hypothetical protein